MVEFLVASGADVNHRENRGRTALFLAAESGDLATVQALLAVGADITIGEASGATVLHAAAAAGSVPIMQLCIDRDINVSSTEQVSIYFFDGCVPLESVVRSVECFLLPCGRLEPLRCTGCRRGPRRAQCGLCSTEARL